ncbi:hypothetical protein K488DRAFT_61271 [Vararia minispora EC-137]|uniref:Uncharacterized protein n=1 Tax=Vararia minispora EC-137 TaxID=1314806 RepID=A0ACB8Q6Y7_9AGAM|nr:hypothetical protein K488DRAFT_61271 [Vararia minispora EC-137]
MAPSIKHGTRPPKIDLATLLAQHNPTVDLKLDAYHQKTSEFLKAVSDYSARATSEISQRRQAHDAEKKKIEENAQAIEQETSQCKLAELELLATIEREKEETKEAEGLLQALRREHSSVQDASTSVEAEIEQYEALVESLQRERAMERASLEEQTRIADAELSEIEFTLGLVMEGVGTDQILIRFQHLPRDCSLVLDVSSWTYRVLTMSPGLPNLPVLLDELNETRDLYLFIKKVRQEFCSLG